MPMLMQNSPLVYILFYPGRTSWKIDIIQGFINTTDSFLTECYGHCWNTAYQIISKCVTPLSNLGIEEPEFYCNLWTTFLQVLSNLMVQNMAFQMIKPSMITLLELGTATGRGSRSVTRPHPVGFGELYAYPIKWNMWDLYFHLPRVFTRPNQYSTL